MAVFEVITIGSALLDVFMKSEKFVVSEKTLGLELNGKTEVSEVEVCSGGGGSNNAVSFARKGIKTGIIAEMGTDLVATTIIEELKKEQVDVGMLVTEQDETTGISTIFTLTDGSRSIAVYRGASGMLTEEDIPWYRLDTEWLFISSLGGEMNLWSTLINYAKLNEIKLAVNPGKKELEQIKAWGGINFFEGVEVLICNREEAKILTNIPYDQEEYWRAKEGMPGVKVSVFTDGKKGGRVVVDDELIFYQPKLVRVVEETGAGDAFGSGLVAALIKGKDVTTAIEWGKKQAASVVSYMGSKKGLLTLPQIEGQE